MKINICGIPHTIIQCEDTFDVDSHFAMIDYQNCVIKINKNMTEEVKEESLFHEVVHGILVHLGYPGQGQDEQFVQALANALYQSFRTRIDLDWNEPAEART